MRRERPSSSARPLASPERKGELENAVLAFSPSGQRGDPGEAVPPQFRPLRGGRPVHSHRREPPRPVRRVINSDSRSVTTRSSPRSRGALALGGRGPPHRRLGLARDERPALRKTAARASHRERTPGRLREPGRGRGRDRLRRRVRGLGPPGRADRPLGSGPRPHSRPRGAGAAGRDRSHGERPLASVPTRAARRRRPGPGNLPAN